MIEPATRPSPVCSRATFLLPALLAMLAIALATAAVNMGQANERAMTLAEGKPLSSYMKPGRQFTQWDGYRYEEIIMEGYLSHLPSDPFEVRNSSLMDDPRGGERRLKNVVWYPLYPLLGALVMKLTGLPAHHALTLVSWTCVLLGSMVFYAVARRHLCSRLPVSMPVDAIVPRWGLSSPDLGALYAVTLLLFVPGAVFLYANYTESLFVLLLALFLLCVQRQDWWWAAAVGAVASSCRSQGVLFGPILALVFLLRSHAPLPRRLGKAFLLGLISSLGLLAYMAYLWVHFHDPLVFMKIQIHWDVGIGARQLRYAFHPLHAMTNLCYQAFYTYDFQWPLVIEAASVVIPPIILALGTRYLSLELRLLGWLLWALPFVSNSLAPKNSFDLHWMSMGRFMSVLLPLQILLAMLLMRCRWLPPFLLAISIFFFALLAYQYGGGVWVG